jgi:predicted transcriptional regulator
MTGKQRALEILEALPEDASWDDVLDAFRLDAALEQSLEAVARGDVVPHEDVMRRFAKCSTNPST